MTSRPGWVSVCVQRRRIGAITDEGAARLGIVAGREWTPALAAAFEAESGYVACLHHALVILRHGDQTEAALNSRLLAKGHAPEPISRAIGELRARGILDDARHATALAARHAGRGMGPLLVEAKLRAAGHDAGDAGRAARRAFAGTDAADQAERFLRSRLRVSSSATGAPEKHRHRLYALLIRNGFDDETAAIALRRVLGEDPEP